METLSIANCDHSVNPTYYYFLSAQSFLSREWEHFSYWSPCGLPVPVTKSGDHANNFGPALTKTGVLLRWATLWSLVMVRTFIRQCRKMWHWTWSTQVILSPISKYHLMFMKWTFVFILNNFQIVISFLLRYFHQILLSNVKFFIRTVSTIEFCANNVVKRVEENCCIHRRNAIWIKHISWFATQSMFSKDAPIVVWDVSTSFTQTVLVLVVEQ